MTYKIINIHNLAQEHICCSISEDKNDPCVSTKKAWLHDRIKEGLVFYKLDERGKVFIEYIPSEKAWLPIEAINGFHINCLWVSGKFQKQGHANTLLNYCIKDANKQGKDFISILSAKKKMPFLSDPKFLKHKGFLVADIAPPYYELLYLPLNHNAITPNFRHSVKIESIETKGLVLYYSSQCPFTAKYALLIQTVAAQRGHKLTLIHINSIDEAQKAPAPFTTYSLFLNGKFITNEILSEKKFIKLLEQNNL